MKRAHEDVIGTAPKRNQLEGLGLFDPVPVDVVVPPRAPTIAPPAARPRAKDETGAFGGISNAQRREYMDRMQRDLREPLLALAFARKDVEKAPGVVADDVRRLADQRGMSGLLGDEQRAWSWVGTWLSMLAKEKHLVRYRRGDLTVKRPSSRAGSHGNDQVVYLHPYDYRAQAAA